MTSAARSSTGSTVLLVESPAKARKLQQFLGDQYKVWPLPVSPALASQCVHILPGCRLSCLCSASGRPDWQLWRHTNSLQEHPCEASVAFLQVLASYGHVRDLPAKSGSVQPDEDFRLLWARLKAAQPRLQEIAQAIKEAQTLILATDPDREGEAISWHVQEELAVSSLSSLV